MPLTIACPLCQSVLQVPESEAGQVNRCGSCLQLFQVPELAPPPPPIEPPAASVPPPSYPAEGVPPFLAEAPPIEPERSLPELPVQEMAPSVPAAPMPPPVLNLPSELQESDAGGQPDRAASRRRAAAAATSRRMGLFLLIGGSILSGLLSMLGVLAWKGMLGGEATPPSPPSERKVRKPILRKIRRPGSRDDSDLP